MASAFGGKAGELYKLPDDLRTLGTVDPKGLRIAIERVAQRQEPRRMSFAASTGVVVDVARTAGAAAGQLRRHLPSVSGAARQASPPGAARLMVSTNRESSLVRGSGATALPEVVQREAMPGRRS